MEQRAKSQLIANSSKLIAERVSKFIPYCGSIFPISLTPTTSVNQVDVITRNNTHKYLYSINKIFFNFLAISQKNGIYLVKKTDSIQRSAVRGQQKTIRLFRRVTP